MAEKESLNKLIETLIKNIILYIKQAVSDIIEEAIKEPIARLTKSVFLTIGAAMLAFAGVLALFVSLIFYLEGVLGSYMMAFLVVGISLIFIGAIVGYGGYIYGRKDSKRGH